MQLRQIATLCASTCILQSATAQWSSSSLSQARHDLAATSVGSRAIFAGGFVNPPDLPEDPSDVVDIYDDATGEWRTAVLSQPRGALAATSVGSKAIFAGGEGLAGPSDVIDIYDDATGQWSTATLSEPRRDLAATTVGTLAIFAGGRGASDSATVDIYDDATGQWSTATLSQARWDLAVGSAAGKALFAAGEPSSSASLVDVFDSSTGAWSTTQLPAGGWESGNVGTSIGSKVLFAGGDGSSTSVFDAVAEQWSTELPWYSYHGGTATTVGARAVFFGGQVAGFVSVA